MICVGFLLLSLIIAALIRFSFFSLLEPVTYFFHSECLNRIMENSSAAPELKALVCGESLSAQAKSQIFLASGLIHLFASSGSHLIFLEQLFLPLLPKSKKITTCLIILLLFIYALACRLNPPMTRAFISIVFALCLHKQRLYWTENFKVFVVGLLTLVFNPLWVGSFGLQLTWAAAIVISLNKNYLRKWQSVAKQLLFFVVLWPFLLLLEVPAPSIIVVHLFLTPVISFFLFPAGLLTWLFPFLTVFFEQIMNSLKWILTLLEFQFSAQTQFQDASTTQLIPLLGWIFILMLHFFYHFFEMNQRRRYHV